MEVQLSSTHREIIFHADQRENSNLDTTERAETGRVSAVPVADVGDARRTKGGCVLNNRLGMRHVVPPEQECILRSVCGLVLETTWLAPLSDLPHGRLKFSRLLADFPLDFPLGFYVQRHS